MKKTIVILLSLIFFISCNESRIQTLPQSTGTPGHILLVLSSTKWKSETGDKIREVIKQDYPMLPQQEPLFHLSSVPEESFSQLLHRTRNILQTNISVNVKKPKITVQYDIWASPQVVVTIEANSDKALLEIFENNGDEIINTFEKAERDRLISTYSDLKEQKIIEKIAKRKKIHLTIPKGFKLDVDSSNYMWISRETPRLTQAFIIWSYNYRDTSDLNPKNLLKAQDSITKKYIHGPAEGSYMASEDRVPGQSRVFELDGQYVIEMRGLWHLAGKKAFMGGPYISFTTVDQKRNQIVTVYSYVYAGNQDKRNFVRQMEAILYTLKVVN